MEKKWSFWQVCAGLSGFIAVAMGAVGAHMVTGATSASLVEKASLYQLIHTIVLIWLLNWHGRIACFARLTLLGGITLFCGSLYLKGLSLISAAPFAPAGGLLLMANWLLIIFLKPKSDSVMRLNF